MSDETIDIKPKVNKPAEIQVDGFDFEYWSKLSKKDPEAFEIARKVEIDKYLSTLDADVQERMTRFQWRIEMERKLSKNPLDAAARIYDMMWESVGKSTTALDELTDILNPNTFLKEAKTPKKVKANNNILSFDRKESEAVLAD